MRSKGFGDTVDKFTTATGIKAVVKKAMPKSVFLSRKIL